MTLNLGSRTICPQFKALSCPSSIQRQLHAFHPQSTNIFYHKRSQFFSSSTNSEHFSSCHQLLIHFRLTFYWLEPTKNQN